MVKAIFSKDHKYTVEQMKKARQKAGLNQVEAGQRRIDIVALKEFARIYKKPVDYFLK